MGLDPSKWIHVIYWDTLAKINWDGYDKSDHGCPLCSSPDRSCLPEPSWTIFEGLSTPSIACLSDFPCRKCPMMTIADYEALLDPVHILPRRNNSLISDDILFHPKSPLKPVTCKPRKNPTKPKRPGTAVKVLEKAHEWQNLIDARCLTRLDIARQEGISRARVTQVMRLLDLQERKLGLVGWRSGRRWIWLRNISVLIWWRRWESNRNTIKLKSLMIGRL